MLMNRRLAYRWLTSPRVCITSLRHWLRPNVIPFGQPILAKRSITMNAEEWPSDDEIFVANQEYQRVLTISNLGSRGLGLLALQDFNPDDLVVIGVALYTGGLQDPQTIQTEMKSHTMMDLPARLLNHKCGTANLYIRDNDFGAYNFYARSAIVKDEELTYDFETTEYEMDEQQCHCGSPICRGILRGFKHSEGMIRMMWEPCHIAEYLNNDMHFDRERGADSVQVDLHHRDNILDLKLQHNLQMDEQLNEDETLPLVKPEM